MSSREIAELVNSRHDKVKQSIDRLAARGVIVQPPLGDEHFSDSLGRPRTEQVYRIGKRDSYVIVAQLSPEFTARLVDRWQELEEKSRAPVRQMSTAETLLQMLQMQVEAERRQAEQAAVLERQTKHLSEIDHKLGVIESSQLMSCRPANAEAITHVRNRINRVYGLSHDIIDAVMRQSIYAPKPAGMVKNKHENADGATYAVYWQKDVTACFDRFAKECAPVTDLFFTHPFINGRFRMKRA